MQCSAAFACPAFSEEAVEATVPSLRQRLVSTDLGSITNAPIDSI
jgi:hypothetical protein